MKRLPAAFAIGVIAFFSQGCAILLAAASGDPTAIATATMDTSTKMNAAVDAIDEKDERAVGQGSAFHVIAAYDGLVLEKDLVEYVNDVANLVALQGKRQVVKNDGSGLRIQSRRFFVGVLKDDASYNAFALPGGYILLTQGLLEDLQSESELAWVLGHEIAHVDYEDGLKVLKGQVKGGTLLTDGAFDLKDSALFGKLANGIADTLLKNGFDRNAERKADKLGLEYAAAAGYDPRAADRVLALLGTRKIDTKTHEAPVERSKLLTARIEELANKNAGHLGAERYDQRCVSRLEAYARLARGGAQGGSP